MKKLFTLLFLLCLFSLIGKGQIKTSTTVMKIAANNAIVSGSTTATVGAPSFFLGGKNGTAKVDNYLMFPDVYLPSDVQIKSAYIEFYAYEASNTSASMTIYGESADASLYTTSLANYTSRNYVPTTVGWQSTGAVRRAAYQTPDLTMMINEMLVSGNKSNINLAFKITGDQTGSFRMYSFAGGSSYYPRLVINYETSLTIVSSLVGTSYNDAAQVKSSGAVRLIDAYLALGAVNPVTATYVNTSGIRFQGISIPSTAQIVDAYILFNSYRVSATGAVVKIVGEKGNSPTFAAVNNNISNRISTNRSVIWNSKAWTSTQYVDRTCNLQQVIDEIRLSGWKSGDLMTFLFEGISGDATVYSYNGGTAYQPKLVVEYIDNGAGPQVSTIEADESLVRYVENSLNDAYENVAAKTMSVTSATNFIGGYSGTTARKTGIRFENIFIPSTAEIEDAYIEFTTYMVNANTSNVKIYTEEGNPNVFSTSAGNISGRKLSNIYTTWLTSAWTTALQKNRTPNLKNLIDYKRLNNWTNGQSIAFIFEGNSAGNLAYSQNGNINYQPRLVIKYKDNGNGAGYRDLITDPALMTGLMINELAPLGTTAVERKDWIELYNNSDSDIMITDGVYLSNKNKDRTLNELKNIFIPAHTFMTFIADEANPAVEGTNLTFKLKNGGGSVYLSRKVNGKIVQQDAVDYGAVAYNNSYGRVIDGVGNFLTFIQPTYNSSNNEGKTKIEVGFSKPRGVYEEGFMLSLTPPSSDAIIRYTLDGTSFPSETSGAIYTTPLNITKSTVVRTYAYTPTSNTGIIANSYILLNNYANEKSTGTSISSQWQDKGSITSDDYALALSKAPIISVSTDGGTAYNELSATTEKVVTFEYLDSNVNEDASNFYSLAGGAKFGQWSTVLTNSGVKFKFSKSRGVVSADYPFFDEFPEDIYPAANVIKSLELKEGEDGPQQGDIFGLGYLRYSESITMALQKQMGKYALDTKYVHFITNGTYRGLKTMREDFNAGNIAEIIGGDEDDYVKVDLQDANWDTGVIDEGDRTIWTAVKGYASARDFQSFKKYVDVDDLIKFMLTYMFIDCEREAQAMYNTDPKVMKMKFNINDTDGAFYKPSSGIMAGGGGSSWYKWRGLTSTAVGSSLKGPAGFFSAFAGANKNGLNGNLEFQTLVKDQVLIQMQSEGAPLTAPNVKALMNKNIEILDPLYKVDAAYMSTSATRYPKWKQRVNEVLGETDERVSYNITQWANYGLVHTLQPVTIANNKIENPNSNALAYYTTDGTDPMGNNGIVSSSAILYDKDAGLTLPKGDSEVIVRPFVTGNWGPLTTVVVDNTAAVPVVTTLNEKQLEILDATIYPNPVSDILYVDFKNVDIVNSTLQIYSLTTSNIEMSVKLTQHSNQINVSNLKKGVHIVRITNQNGNSTTGKLVKN